jgi:hypothetical protein
MRQAERTLQREVVLRLRHAPLDALVIGSPNGIYLPARTPAERVLAARIVAQAKAFGQLTPGAADLVVLWSTGSGCIELKRPAEKRLFDRQERGRLSPDQIAFRDNCRRYGIPYAVCESWPEVRETLQAWGRLPADWIDPDHRVGRAA